MYITYNIGHKLSFTQDDIGINGWAIESRIYAEDPVRFLPSIGYLSKYVEPLGIPDIGYVRHIDMCSYTNVRLYRLGLIQG